MEERISIFRRNDIHCGGRSSPAEGPGQGWGYLGYRLEKLETATGGEEVVIARLARARVCAEVKKEREREKESSLKVL